jgi:hypothetical protein
MDVGGSEPEAVDAQQLTATQHKSGRFIYCQRTVNLISVHSHRVGGFISPEVRSRPMWASHGLNSLGSKKSTSI